MPLNLIAALASPLDSLPQQGGYVIFFGLLAGSLLLVGYALLAKLDSSVRGRYITISAAVLLALVAVFFQTRIDAERGFVADQERRSDQKLREIERKKGKEEALKLQYMYMPAGNSLNFMSLNNPALAADYVWLTSLQFVSNSFRRGDKFELLSRFHKTMVDLDPHWVDAEVNGGKVMSALIDEREKSEQSFIYDIERNQDNPKGRWRLRNEAGMLFVTPPSDPKKMAEYSRKSSMYFDQALQEKYFPKEMITSTKDRIARLRLESGSAFYREAENMLAQNATAPDTPESMRDISRRDWLRAHSMAQAAALTDEATAYKGEHGAFPPTLEPIALRFAKPEAFRKDAYGIPFDYDPATGTATSHGVKAIRAVQASHVIKDILALYRDEHKGKYPESLDDLSTFVRNDRKPPLHPPSVMIVDAIGSNLDCSTGPLGPWKYDAEKGDIILPPECDIKALYDHVNDFDWKATGITRIK